MVILFHGNAITIDFFTIYCKKSMVELLPYNTIYCYHGMPTPATNEHTLCSNMLNTCLSNYFGNGLDFSISCSFSRFHMEWLESGLDIIIFILPSFRTWSMTYSNYYTSIEYTESFLWTFPSFEPKPFLHVRETIPESTRLTYTDIPI